MLKLMGLFDERNALKMRRICFLMFLLALSVGGYAAQTPEKPSVALLSFGISPGAPSVTVQQILHQLYLDGYLSADDIEALDSQSEIDGENIQIALMEAGWQYNRLGNMVEAALDRDVDVIVAFTTPVAQAAIQATRDLDDPPAVIFASTFYPFAAGLAEAPCVKPSHVTGSQIVPPYELLIDLALAQQPGLTRLGTVFSADQISGVEGSREVVAIGEARGLEVIQAAVTQPVDFIAAVDGLASRGVEALIPSIDSITSRGLPAVVSTASENLMPVYYPSLGGISSDAMISAGYYQQQTQGINTGRKLVAWLRGELDIAATAIEALSGDGVGVNLIVAESLDLEIASEILERADIVLNEEGGKVSDRVTEAVAEARAIEEGPERGAAARAYLDSLRCTDDMIAEQQAQLESQ